MAANANSSSEHSKGGRTSTCIPASLPKLYQVKSAYANNNFKGISIIEKVLKYSTRLLTYFKGKR